MTNRVNYTFLLIFGRVGGLKGEAPQTNLEDFLGLLWLSLASLGVAWHALACLGLVWPGLGRSRVQPWESRPCVRIGPGGVF